MSAPAFPHRTILLAGLLIHGISPISDASDPAFPLPIERTPVAIANRLKADLPLPRVDDRFVTSASCQKCHPSEHASWHRSYHRTMTQSAEAGHVIAPFDGTNIRSDGMDYRVFRDGENLFAEMPDPDLMMYSHQGGPRIAEDKIPRVVRPVVMATGSHHYQTYWVSSPRYDRLLQTLPLVYLIADQRWIPREAAFMRGPDDTARFITQWNHHCIRCHSTGGNPGLDQTTGRLRTEVGELGIACEACHGPAGDHVRLQRHLALKPDSERAANPDRTLVNPANLDHRRSSEICGQCHSVFVMREEFALDEARFGPLYRPGDDLARTRTFPRHPGPEPTMTQAREFRRNQAFFQERWWDDGTILAGGRELTGLSVSACYTRGTISCGTCHTQHKGDPVNQLRPELDGPKSCTGCHSGDKFTKNLSAHTFHKPGSSGSDCLNCHMPRTSYALFKAIRSHQIQSPQVPSSARHGVPNACNLCHLDKTLAWTDEHLRLRYGQLPVELTKEQRELSAALLWLLKGDAAQRVITAWHIGWQPAQLASGNRWLAPFQARLLTDPYGVVRYVAHRSLRTLPGFEDYAYDFLAPPAELEQHALTVRRRWSNLPAVNRSERNRPELLLDSDGLPDETRIDSLVRDRNNRPVTIKE